MDTAFCFGDGACDLSWVYGDRSDSQGPHDQYRSKVRLAGVLCLACDTVFLGA